MITTRRRALVVAYCFPPHAAIGTHRTVRLVSHLVQAGWDVDVLTAKPDAYLPGTPVDPQFLERIPSKVRVIRSGAFRGFTKVAGWILPIKQVIRGAAQHLPTGPASAPSGNQAARRPSAKETVEELCALPDKEIGWFTPAVTRALRSLSNDRPDVIFSSAPPWTTHLVAARLASSFRCSWVADFRDPWVRSPWTRYRSRPATAIAKRLETHVIRQANAVVFTTATARKEYESHYGVDLGRKFHVVFNGCDPTELADPDTIPAGGDFTILHAGSLYGGRSPMPLLDALADVRKTHAKGARVKLRFLGATSFPGVDLSQACRERGIAEVVEFLPRVAREESLRQIQNASALLILQAGTTVAIPGKLYEYLAAGRPVFALCEDGEMARFITENRLGIAVSPADRQGIADALLTLLDRPPESWVRADPMLFDGRLRAAELASIMDCVFPTRTSDRAAAVDAASWEHRV